MSYHFHYVDKITHKYLKLLNDKLTKNEWLQMKIFILFMLLKNIKAMT